MTTFTLNSWRISEMLIHHLKEAIKDHILKTLKILQNPKNLIFKCAL